MYFKFFLLIGLLKFSEVKPSVSFPNEMFEINKTIRSPFQNVLRMIANKVECEWDEKLLTNGSCSMTPDSTGGALVTIRGTFVKDANKIWVFQF
jgi:hypothetical protein